MAKDEQAATTTLVWQGPRDKTAARWASTKGLHARLLTPAENGVSKEYMFGPEDHAVAVDAADAAIIMDGPDKAEFRIEGGH